MARDRSKSVVKTIASDALSLRDGKFADSGAVYSTSIAYPTLKQSRSYEDIRIIEEQIRPAGGEALQTYPFTKKEAIALDECERRSYNYDVVPEPEILGRINGVKNSRYLDFQTKCSLNVEHIDDLVEEVDLIMESMGNLMVKYNAISQETLEFDRESSQLLNVSVRYEELINQIDVYLKKFENLEPITKSLSSPGRTFINKEAFKSILIKLDQSLEFFESHQHFKDAEIYLIKFRQCMTRSLTLIRNYLIKEIRKLSLTITEKMSKDVSSDLLIYNEFNEYIQNSNFNEQVNEIISRIPAHTEYEGLLDDVLNSFYSVRMKMLALNTKQEHISDNDDSVKAFQRQLSAATRVIDREYKLLKKFFVKDEISPSLSSSMYDYLRDAIDLFYDELRSIVLKEVSISKLCQVTGLLQKYYEFEEVQGDINYGLLFQPILHDTQSRLIFRTQNYVDQKLTKYKPTIEDLRLGNKRNSNAKPNSLDIEYEENLFDDTYIPLAKALTLLSNIYELINSVVFDDLAHYIVHSCIALLKDEFYKLSISHLGIIGTQLNYIKHLVILRTQINNFDIQFTRNDYSIDFLGGLNDIWTTLRSGEFTFNNNGLINLVSKSAPKIVNNMIDANYEIELELNNAVNDFLQEAVNATCEVILAQGGTKHPTENCAKFKNDLPIKVTEFYGKIKMYIDDRNILKFLMSSMSNLIIVSYETFYNKIQDLMGAHELPADVEIAELEEISMLLNNTIVQLYEADEVETHFNEDILNDIDSSSS